jgi:glycosyltransferase involved in cell wall biosynthesis
LNVGGPAYHVSLLSGCLDPKRYDTLLVTGEVGRGEASLEQLADRYGAALKKLEPLGPRINAFLDLRALVALRRIALRFRPDIVHTHTAKAGFLGRLAAATLRPRPVIVHTYHGHVLEGYFGPAQSWLFARLERAAASVSDRLIGVSNATVGDLVRLGIAPESRFRTVPIGLDLEPFLADSGAARLELRHEMQFAPDDVVVGYVGRLVPIKRLDVAIRAIAAVRRSGITARLLIVGDGQEREGLARLATYLGARDAVIFAGYRSDPVNVARAIDIAILTSDNEGTPVSLIEAAASGRPAVATDVGGVRDVVTPATGVLVSRQDAVAVAAGITRLATTPEVRRRMGEAAREHVRRRFSAERLLTDIDALYCDLLRDRCDPPTTRGHGSQ